MDEFLKNVERAGEDEREEKTKSGEIGIALRAKRNCVSLLKANGRVRDSLEFPRSEVSLGANILRALASCFRKLDFGRHPEHALDRIYKQYGDKSARKTRVTSEPRGLVYRSSPHT